MSLRISLRNLTLKWLLLAAACSASHLGAQTAGQDFTFQVSTAQAWIDTGLDLQSGDVLEISANANVPAASGARACDPAGAGSAAAQTTGLPLPTAPAGALIARLHAQGAAPILVGASGELRIAEPSHLFLGINVGSSPSCQGGFAVKVNKRSAGSTAGAGEEEQQGRKAQLKSQLSTAAQIFMSGQFGAGKSDSTTTNSGSSSAAPSGNAGDSAAAAPLLKLSDAPLGADLRGNLDSLPRRVNDQFHNLGDMVNFVIIGAQKDVQAALDAATWHVADTSNENAVLSAVLSTYDNKDYLRCP
jgi:hypothetical protein